MKEKIITGNRDSENAYGIPSKLILGEKIFFVIPSFVEENMDGDLEEVFSEKIFFLSELGDITINEMNGIQKETLLRELIKRIREGKLKD